MICSIERTCSSVTVDGSDVPVRLVTGKVWLGPGQGPRRVAEFARLRRWKPLVWFRSVAGRLGMSVGGVARAQAGQEALDWEVSSERDLVLAKYGGGGLAGEAAQAAADCERLNDLELHRLLGLSVGSGGWGRVKPVWVVIAAIVVLVGAGITGYLVINRHPASPFDPASLPQADTPSVPASPPGPRPTALSITGLRNPEGVAVDAAGDVYVADHGNRVVRWSAASSNQSVLAFTGLNQPGAVAVDIAGDVYVADWGNSRVLRWSTRSNTQIELPFHDLDHPGGVAVDAAGDVYVADSKNRVVRLAAGWRTQTDLPITGLNRPGGVAVDAAGDVYVTDSKNRVVALTAGSTTQTELPFTGLNHPHGVAVDTVGDVYVTDYYNNRVVEWAATSNTQTVLPLTGLSKPLDVAVDTAGNLYVTFNGNNRVLKLPMH
jgi:DNA-binding beta-propeller fold protein YncE